MRIVARLGTAVMLALVLAGVRPAGAWAHATLVATVPQASGTVAASPSQVSLTYSEPVEPRFAIVSVTDAGGHQQAAGPPRSGSSPDTIEVPVHQLPSGWYLVYWRVISADGHPVRGAYTFAVGPSPGPAPQFVIPSISETAVTTPLVVTRWIALLGAMLGVGLCLFRLAFGRPAETVEPGVLRAVTLAMLIALATALVAIPLYVLLATSQFALRSVVDLSGLVPLVRASALGRAWIDLEIAVALFGLAGLAAVWLDRPQRAQRSVAALLALIGALLAAAALLAVPGLSGHPAQTSPAGLALGLDWLHVAAASIWIGGLVALLLVAWRSRSRRLVLARIVPRFSRVAFVSVVVLVTTGVIAAILHLPTLASLWQTSYGRTILVKAALLTAAALLGAVNFTRTSPRLTAAAERNDAARGDAAVSLLRRVVSGEFALLTATVLAAVILTSLPPPPKALADVGQVSAHVGPGPVTARVQHGSLTVGIRVAPNRAATPNTFSVQLTQSGKPVHGAEVIGRFLMLDMEMGQLTYTLPETAPGTYQRTAPALVMVGHWGIAFDIRVPGQAPFTVTVIDKAGG